MNIVPWANIFIAMDGICLDRLPKQRSALHKPRIPSGFPPQRGGFWSLSVGGGLRRDGNYELCPRAYPRPDELLETAAHG
jgi:hypothetical protein